MLMELQPAGNAQGSLWPDGRDRERTAKVMAAVDAINRNWGRGTIRSAVIAQHQPWSMKAERKSPRWTTCWDELPVLVDRPGCDVR